MTDNFVYVKAYFTEKTQVALHFSVHKSKILYTMADKFLTLVSNL
jgi:hypothetical protein